MQRSGAFSRNWFHNTHVLGIPSTVLHALALLRPFRALLSLVLTGLGSLRSLLLPLLAVLTPLLVSSSKRITHFVRSRARFSKCCLPLLPTQSAADALLVLLLGNTLG